MGTSSGSGATSFAAKMSAMIAGLQLQGVLPSGWSVWIGGANYTESSAATVLQKSVTVYQAVDGARAATKQAENARTAAQPGAKAFYDQLVDALRAELGASSPMLAKYGVKPTKARAMKTAQEKAQSAVKAKATRKARGTVGPKAKLAIKATVVPQLVEVTPGSSTPAGTSSSTSASASTTPTASGSSTPTPSGSSAT